MEQPAPPIEAIPIRDDARSSRAKPSVSLKDFPPKSLGCDIPDSKGRCGAGPVEPVGVGGFCKEREGPHSLASIGGADGLQGSTQPTGLSAPAWRLSLDAGTVKKGNFAGERSRRSGLR